MKTFLKWAAVVVVVIATFGFLAFLYFIPPFFTTPPETFGKLMADAAPAVTDIADPAERAIAERGRYIVMTSGCIGCHAVVGSQGPDLSLYLGGGGLKIQRRRIVHRVHVHRLAADLRAQGIDERFSGATDARWLEGSAREHQLDVGTWVRGCGRN